MKEEFNVFLYAIPLVVFGPLFLYILWNFGIRELIKIPGEMRLQKQVDQERVDKFEKERKRKRGVKAIGVVRGPNKTIMGYAMQVVMYAIFGVGLGYFAASPAYTFIPVDSAQIKLSISHPGQKKEVCVKQSRAELAKLPPNMRTSMKCGRERWPVYIEMELDGEKVFAKTSQPKGLSNDGPSIFYQKFTVPAGKHEITVRIRDQDGNGFNFQRSESINLKGSQIFVASFDNLEHKVTFR